MTSHHVDHEALKRILNQVHKGMNVYSNQNDKIGTVEAVFLGTVNADEAARGTGAATADRVSQPDDTFVEMIAELFNPGEVPDEVSERLRYEGFIRVDAKGLFGVDRFVMPDRIDHVSQDGVYLKVAEASELPKK